MNMGIGDGVDLGWKIAARLQGWGGPGAARQLRDGAPPRTRVRDRRGRRQPRDAGRQIWRDGLDADGPEGEALRREVGERIAVAKLREFNTLGVVLGLRATTARR